MPAGEQANYLVDVPPQTLEDSGELGMSQKTKAQKMSEYYSQHIVEIDEVDSCLEEGSTQNIPV